MLHRRGELAHPETEYRLVLAMEPANARALHNLGLIALHTGNVETAHRMMSRVIEIEPDMAEAHSNLGLALDRLGRPDDARAAFERAIGMRPDYADAWSNLAVNEKSRGFLDAAIEKFRRARDIAPTRPEIAANLGAALVEAGALEEGVACLMSALTRAPHSPVIHFNLGKARYLLGDLDHAIRDFRNAIALDPGFADAHHTLGHALLAAGSLADGWREYEWRWRAKRFHVPPRSFPIAPWQGESLAGKRILIWSEQGVGDKLLFASLLPEIAAAAAACTVEIEERLVPLFRRSFPDVAVVTRRDPPDPALDPAGFDVQAPIGDLPRYLRGDPAALRPSRSYLASDPDRTAALDARYRRDGRASVGIAWASRAGKGVPLAAFAPLLSVPGTRWVSLQYGDHAAEIAKVSDALGVEIVHDATIDPLGDFDGSVAQTAAMDAVVTIQNASLYVAGGLGRPTFALIPSAPDWRWLGRTSSPWHQTVRLYPRAGNDGVAESVARMTADFKAWRDHFAR